MLHTLCCEIKGKSTEEKLVLLKNQSVEFEKKIQNGELLFSDEKKIIRICHSLTDYLFSRFKSNQLSEFEVSVLDKMLEEGVCSISFCLMSDVKNQKHYKQTIALLSRQNYVRLGEVGYILIR